MAIPVPFAVPSRPDLFSVRALGTALVFAVGGFLAGAFVPVPLFGLGGLVGVFAGGFLFGLRRRAYAETAVAGAVAAGVGTMLTSLFATVAFGAVPVVALGAGAGLLAALCGHYFGRDLLAGVTREL